MRIYLGITGTGGMIKGSFEVGDIFKLKLPEERYFDITGKGVPYSKNEKFEVWNEMPHEHMNDKYGWDMQEYAIEIKDFREEDTHISDFVLTSNFEEMKMCDEFKNIGYEEDYYHCEFGNFDDECSNCSKYCLKKLPQGFAYINKLDDDISDDKAILIPIHQKWFDMIASGEKKYEFRNKLPKALRGE